MFIIGPEKSVAELKATLVTLTIERDGLIVAVDELMEVVDALKDQIKQATLQIRRNNETLESLAKWGN